MSIRLTVKVMHELSDEFISDVLITAFDASYGGCWYWADPYGPDWLHWRAVPDLQDELWTGVDLSIKEETGSAYLDAQEHFGVDAAVLRGGIQEILDEWPQESQVYRAVLRAVLEEDAGEIDAVAADAIVQLGLFGKLVFG